MLWLQHSTPCAAVILGFLDVEPKNNHLARRQNPNHHLHSRYPSRFATWVE